MFKEEISGKGKKLPRVSKKICFEIPKKEQTQWKRYWVNGTPVISNKGCLRLHVFLFDGIKLKK